MAWLGDAVVYQIYPRSFQDSDGDGVGDLAGITARLDHVAALGADAIWLSPIYPSPGVDLGYDVSDFVAVDPLFGTVADFDALLAAAHARGLRVLLDIVPCHSSIAHPWFRDHPEFYVWADGRDGGPPNNWVANFGGPAWTFDAGRKQWYLHSFYPEQPDLNWAEPGLVAAMQDVVRYWRGRGADGFRLDALQGIAKDPLFRDDPPAGTDFGLPLPLPYGALDHVNSTDGDAAVDALAALRAAAGDAVLIGEVYLPARRVARYLTELDAAFAFELLHAGFDAAALRAAIGAWTGLRGRDGGPGAAWVISNHDFPRVPDRFGPANVRAAAVLLLTLPGAAFVYQGEELGQRDAPGPGDRYDRHGRDGARHPVQWEPDPATGGFTTATPWLAPVDAARRNARDQAVDPGSVLSLYRELIALRPRLRGAAELIDAAPGVVAYRRGEHVVAVNTTAQERPAPVDGTALIATHAGPPERLAPHAATVTRAPARPG